MTYYYLHPKRPQYFFPVGFKKHKLFLSFFKPYSFLGFLSWFLFRNLALYRHCFIQTNIEAYIPEKKIRQLVGEDCLLAFNTGTTGPEQKITALGVDKNLEFFIKYAETNKAIKNVSNENSILKQLTHLDFVPKVLDYFEYQDQVLLKTDILKGDRLQDIPLDEHMIKRLFIISKQKLDTIYNMSTSLKTVFAHGDFCPWNMMRYNEDIFIYDWEMAGAYTLGFDLFTYIFQTNFLLQPKKPIDRIIIDNLNYINMYFNHFNISDWKDYLMAFGEKKVQLEKIKGEKGMKEQYIKLLSYAQKT